MKESKNTNRIIKGLIFIFIPFPKFSSNLLWVLGASATILGVFAGQDEFTFEAFFVTILVVMIFRYYAWNFGKDGN